MSISTVENYVPESIVIQNKLINEEYKLWKKTIPSLYHHITTLHHSTSQLSISETTDNHVDFYCSYNNELILNRLATPGFNSSVSSVPTSGPSFTPLSLRQKWYASGKILRFLAADKQAYCFTEEGKLETFQPTSSSPVNSIFLGKLNGVNMAKNETTLFVAGDTTLYSVTGEKVETAEFDEQITSIRCQGHILSVTHGIHFTFRDTRTGYTVSTPLESLTKDHAWHPTVESCVVIATLDGVQVHDLRNMSLVVKRWARGGNFVHWVDEDSIVVAQDRRCYLYSVLDEDEDDEEQYIHGGHLAPVLGVEGSKGTMISWDSECIMVWRPYL